MISLKSTRNFNFPICEEETCQQESTRIWASSQSRIVDLCDFHYGEASKS
jgi:hypothetical protein